MINYGKFYNIREYLHHFCITRVIDEISTLGDPYNETASAQGTKIESKDEHEWGHCGRENSPSGTEGSFEVHLEESGEKIAKIYWDCPYIGSNKLEKHDVKTDYDISFDGFSIPSGPLGEGNINVRED